jgi:hypothetical protein
MTSSNMVIVLGLVASALFLLANIEPDKPEQLAGLVPKAFSATGYALLCGVLLSYQSQKVSVMFRRQGHTNLDRLQGYEDLELDTDSSAVVVNTADQQLQETRRMVALVENMNHLLTQQGGSILDAHERFKELIEVSTVKTSLTSIVKSQMEVMVHSVQDLQVAILKLSEVVDERATEDGSVMDSDALTRLSSSLEQLRFAITEQNQAILNKQAHVIGEQTLELAREAMARFGSIAQNYLNIQIEGMETQIQKQIMEVYDSAGKEAADQLRRALKTVHASSGTTVQGLKEVTRGFDQVNLVLSNLSVSMQDNAQHVNTAASSYQQAAHGLTRQATALVHSLAELDGHGDGSIQPIMAQLNSTAEILESAGRRLSSDMLLVKGQEEKIRRVRAFLENSLSNRAVMSVAVAQSPRRVNIPGPSRHGNASDERDT